MELSASPKKKYPSKVVTMMPRATAGYAWETSVLDRTNSRVTTLRANAARPPRIKGGGGDTGNNL